MNMPSVSGYVFQIRKSAVAECIAIGTCGLDHIVIVSLSQGARFNGWEFPASYFERELQVAVNGACTGNTDSRSLSAKLFKMDEDRSQRKEEGRV